MDFEAGFEDTGVEGVGLQMRRVCFPTKLLKILKICQGTSLQPCYIDGLKSHADGLVCGGGKHTDVW